MKKWMLFLYGISLILLGFAYSNVEAKEVIPHSSIINNQIFSNNSTTNNVSVGTTINSNASFNYNIIITNGYASENNSNIFLEYPFTLLYFYSNRDNLESTSRLVFSQTSSCSVSCFNFYNMKVVNIGTGQYNGNTIYLYVMILPIQKFNSNPDVGDSEVTGTIQFTNKGSNSMYVRITNVLLGDNNTIESGRYKDIASIINSIGSVTSSLNTGFGNIISNSNSNTQNIINNQNTNANTAHQDSQAINNSLNDETGVSNNDVSSKTTEWSNKLLGSGPVSQMVLMPITLLNGYVSGMNASCTPYNLGNLMGTDITLPCINISNYLGVTLWGVIDVLFSGFMIYAMGKKFVKIFNDFTNLRDNQMDELYGGGK